MTSLFRPMTHSSWRNWAARRVTVAIASGHLVRPAACERCGRTAKQIEAHHFAGYQHPLTVSWVCRSCHRRAHREHVDFPEYHPYWRTLWSKVAL